MKFCSTTTHLKLTDKQTKESKAHIKIAINNIRSNHSPLILNEVKNLIAASERSEESSVIKATYIQA
ncbi:hypothetical protein [Polluticaenibacter yanchengensis]|uniref:Uncharacterized protein n=1 Tax=Polluticaenibacter yanchengensis TaxID=3014562 RepID=A0ABT4UJM9_9BACT|nr:hypothetical protein [Chitinophagaceae bacterium LY-5]